jgi:hypothetical protein
MKEQEETAFTGIRNHRLRTGFCLELYKVVQAQEESSGESRESNFVLGFSNGKPLMG